MFGVAVRVKPLSTLTWEGPNMASSLVSGVLGPEYGDGSAPLLFHVLPSSPSCGLQLLSRLVPLNWSSKIICEAEYPSGEVISADELVVVVVPLFHPAKV